MATTTKENEKKFSTKLLEEYTHVLYVASTSDFVKRVAFLHATFPQPNDDTSTNEVTVPKEAIRQLANFLDELYNSL